MKKTLSKPQPKTPILKLGDDGNGSIEMTSEQARCVCGSNNEAIPIPLLNQMLNSITNLSEDKANSAIAMLAEIAPRDGLEGMLAAQMVATHNLGLECAGRAALPDQTYDGLNANINRTTKLMRTFTAQMEALQRYRNGGKQTISVQHVNVENGGQAIVGNVTGGRGNG